MQGVNFSGLDDLDRKLKEVISELPEAKRELHEEIAKGLKEEVDRQITASGVRDSSGRVQGWQKEHVGSRGGYAAIRPVAASTGNNSPGAITNYLENGHRIREPGGNSQRYRPRIHKPYVDGYHFYQAAGNRAESKAIEAAENFVEDMMRKLEE